MPYKSKADWFADNHPQQKSESTRLKELRDSDQSCLTCSGTKVCQGKLLYCETKKKYVRQYCICAQHQEITFENCVHSAPVETLETLKTK